MLDGGFQFCPQWFQCSQSSECSWFLQSSPGRARALVLQSRDKGKQQTFKALAQFVCLDDTRTVTKEFISK